MRFALLAVFPLAAGTICGIAAPTAAKDYYLTIGGGFSPASNQVSLEKNVQFFSRLLADRYPGGTAHDIYFSDGDSPHRDLQFFDPAQDVPAPIGCWLASITRRMIWAASIATTR